MEIHSRNFKIMGPFGIKPYGEPRNPKGFRVIDMNGRKISGPGTKREAEALCDLLNDALIAGSHIQITVH